MHPHHYISPVITYHMFMERPTTYGAYLMFPTVEKLQTNLDTSQLQIDRLSRESTDKVDK